MRCTFLVPLHVLERSFTPCPVAALLYNGSNFPLARPGHKVAAVSSFDGGACQASATRDWRHSEKAMPLHWSGNESGKLAPAVRFRRWNGLARMVS